MDQLTESVRRSLPAEAFLRLARAEHVVACLWRIRKMTGANFNLRTIKRRPYSWRDGNSAGKNDVMTFRDDALRHVRKHLSITDAKFMCNAFSRKLEAVKTRAAITDGEANPSFMVQFSRSDFEKACARSQPSTVSMSLWCSFTM